MVSQIDEQLFTQNSNVEFQARRLDSRKSSTNVCLSAQSLCFSVSLWLFFRTILNHRGTENTEVAQRRTHIIVISKRVVVESNLTAKSSYSRSRDFGAAAKRQFAQTREGG